MSCSPNNLRDYVMGEVTGSARQALEIHLKGCGACSEELRQLRLTQAALLTLPDEELPQRIAFVSDKVFEPSVLRRFLAAFWNSAARLGFASAACLLMATLVFALALRPAAPVLVQQPAPAVDLAKLEAGFNARLEDAIRKQERRTADLLAAAEHRHQIEQKAVALAVEENLAVMQKRFGVMLTAANYGEGK